MPGRRIAALALLLAGSAACHRAPATPTVPMPNVLAADEAAQGFRLLFDGTTTTGWRGYHRADMPAGWQVREGALVRVASAGDIITREQFANFELRLQWRVQAAGNSGIMYRVSEDGAETYHSGPEMQVLDDAGHPDGRNRLTSAGACYALYASPPGIVRAAGEWNDVRLVVDGAHVEHWLNGVKVVEYELGSADWQARVAASKFHEWPRFGTYPRGHIALQDHTDLVAFRSIRIKELP
jgi:hypothetical protein